MKRYFLIDFENVADTGLNGFFELTEEDTVDLFYTQKNNRISIDFFKSYLDHTGAAAIRLRKVAAGNQALDLQLASFLGSLIAEKGEEREYCIISKDKGFGCLPAFWENQKGGGSVRQAGSILEALAQNPAPAEQAAPAAPKTSAGQKTAAEQKAAAAVQEPEAEPPQNPPETEKPKNAAHSGAETEKGKPAAQPNEKTVLNVRVQQVLSKAKLDSQIISQTASLIAKNFGDQKIKQTVYRTLIKRHGQKQGLEVYNLVKPLLK